MDDEFECGKNDCACSDETRKVLEELRDRMTIEGRMFLQYAMPADILIRKMLDRASYSKDVKDIEKANEEIDRYIDHYDKVICLLINLAEWGKAAQKVTDAEECRLREYISKYDELKAIAEGNNEHVYE